MVLVVGYIIYTVRANSGYCAKLAAGDGALVPLYHPPLPKKPALRLCPLVEEKEEKEKEEKKKI